MRLFWCFEAVHYIRPKNRTAIITVIIIIAVLFLCNFSNSVGELTSLNKANVYYVAGVVEFMPTDLKSNLDGYLKIIQSVEAKDTDIIVFPESTLNDLESLSFVPDPTEKIVPCGSSAYADFLLKLSCAAKYTRKYIVINISEREKCTAEGQKAKSDPRPCALNGVTVYNTNVVFDRTGAVISRYRKWNLFEEPRINVTFKPDYGVFETDFGIKFGHFICFDIMFFTPARELLQSGITDIVYPSMWYSQLPFLSAVQTQQAWAFSNNINLLAAGANVLADGNTGSGIYVGKSGALVSVMNPKSQREIYVAKVPKKILLRKFDEKLFSIKEPTLKEIKNENMDDLHLKTDHLYNYSTLILNKTAVNSYTNLCHNELCCEFKVKMIVENFSSPSNNNQSSYEYRLVVYNGNRTFGGYKGGHISTCAVIACLNENQDSCGRIFSSYIDIQKDITFTRLEISAKFPTNQKSLIMPTSLDWEIMPLKVSEFQYDEQSETISNGKTYKDVTIKLNEPKSNLLTFAIYANDYTGRGSSLHIFSVGIFNLILCLLLLRVVI